MAQRNRRSSRSSRSPRRQDHRRRRRPQGGPNLKVLQNLASITPQANLDTSGEWAPDFIPALFSIYPQLIDRLPWLSLRSCEEPSMPLQLRRSQHLFGQNYMFWKEESEDADFLPDGAARKLEFSFGDFDPAEAGGTKIVLADYVDGSFGFNATRLARALGMKPELLLLRSRLTSASLSRIFALKEEGIKVRVFERRSQLDWALKRKEFLSRFFKLKVMPFGGVSSRSALAYLSAMLELKSQQAKGLPQFDIIFVPVDSGLSFLGLELGRRMLGLDGTKIIGLSTRLDPKTLAVELEALSDELVSFLSEVLKEEFSSELGSNSFEIISAKTNDLEACLRWTNRFLELEGRSVDVLHSGPAIMTAAQYLRDKRIEGKKILFWNTHIGIPANENLADIEKLKWPSGLKSWELTPELRAVIS